MRVGLVDREQGDDQVAFGTGAHDLVGADDGEGHRAGADHLDGWRARAAGGDRHVETVLAIEVVDFGGVKAAELRLGFPVELQSCLGEFGFGRSRFFPAAAYAQ